MPGRRAPILVHLAKYARVEDLERDLRADVNPADCDEEFASTLVADLIERAHYY